MSDTPRVGIEVAVDGSAAEAGLARVDAAVTRTGRTLDSLGERGGAALDSVGTESAAAAGRLDTATRNMVGSIQRTTAAMSSAKKGTAEYYEALANQRGIDVNVLRPYLAQLDEVAKRTALAAEAQRQLDDSTKFLANLRERTEGIGRTAADLAELRAAQLGVSEAAEPMIRRMREAEQAGESAFGSIGETAAKCAGPIAAVAAALAAVALGGAAMVNSAINDLAELDDMAQKTGASIEGLSKIQKLGAVFGTEMASIDGALTKLSKGMATADDETNKTQKALAALGVSARDSANKLRDPSEVLVDVAKKLGDYNDGAAKAALITDLVGKSGADMLPFLNDLAENYEKVSGVSADATTSAAAFQDQLGWAKLRLSELFTTIAIDALPALNDLAGAFLDVYSKQTGLNDGHAKQWADDLAMGIAKAVDAAVILGRALQIVWNATKAVGADLGLLGKVVVNTNPMVAAYKALNGGSPLQDLKAALAERNKAVVDANTELADLLSRPLNQFEDAMNARLAARGQASDTPKGPEKGDLNYTTGADAAAKAAVAAAKQEEAAYINLIAAIKGKTEENRLELASTGAVTEGQKLRIKIDQELLTGKLKLSAAHRAVVMAALDEVDATEALVQVQKAEKDSMAWMQQSALARNASNAALKTEYELYGQSADARQLSMIAVKAEADLEKFLADERAKGIVIGEELEAQLRAEVDMRVAVEKATLAQSKALGYANQLAEENKKFGLQYIVDERERAAAQLALDAEVWRERIRLAGEGTEAQKTLQQNFDTWYQNQSIKPALDEQKKMWQSIESTAHDTFVSIMDGGKDAATRLRDTFKNVFFDWLYQQTIKKWIINIGTSLSGTAGASGVAGTATGGTSSAIGSGLASAVSGLFGAGGVSGSLAAGAGWLTGSTTLGGALSAGASLVGTGTLAGAASGLGVIAGALGPIALGVAGIMAIVNKLDDSGTYHTGGASSASAAGTTTIRAESLNFQPTKVAQGTNDMTAQLAASVVKILDSTATTFGKTAGYTAATAFADDTSKDGAWGALLIKNIDQTLVNWQDTRTSRWAPKEFADGAAGQAQYLAEVAKSVRTALDSIGLPGWAQGMVASLGNAPTLEQLATVVDQVNATQSALVVMGQHIAGFATMTSDATTALLAASGGISALSANASTYYDAFYTEAEKNQAVAKQVADSLQAVNLVMPETREAYRAMVDQQLALGAAGAPAVAALLSVSGAFAQIVPATEAATQAVADNTSALELAADRRKLEIQIMELTGDAAGALAAQRADEMAAANASLRPLYERIYALQDEASAAEVAAVAAEEKARIEAEAAQAAAAAVEKGRQLAQQAAQLDIQIMQLQGNAAGALAAQRELELAGVDETLRARYQLIYALQDEKTAADLAAQALKDSETALLGFVTAALSGVRQSIQAEKDKVQTAYEASIAALDVSIGNVTDSIGRMQSLSDSLRSTLDGMTMQGQESASRASAQAQIQAALAIAKASGVLQDAESLSSALSAATRFDTSEFASVLDYQREFARTASTIAELSGLTDGQLSDAQKQLKALDDQSTMLKDANTAEIARLDGLLAAAQAQVDAINGVDGSVLSVAAAIATLNASIAGLKAGATPSNPNGAGLTVDGLYQSVLGRSADAGGLSFWTQAYGSSVDQSEIADFIKAAAPELAAKQGGTWKEWLRAHGVPGYAAGGSHEGGWRVVGEVGPELEYTGPSQIYSNGASRNLFEGMEKRLASLEQVMATGLSRLIAETKRGADAAENVDENTRDEEVIA